MNPGLGEEAGRVAGGVVDALKAQPAVLALTVANIGMMVFIFFALSSAAKFRNEVLKENSNYQSEVAQLLAMCAAGPRTRLQSDESTPVELPKPNEPGGKP